MKYAKVIVDVPSQQTDRPFDYVIPPAMKAGIQIGSRVGVRFGPRLLLGFVVGLSPETELDPRKVRPIEVLHDLEPPLSEDLLQLADWIAQTYLCPKIIVLQAMLPRALKARNKKRIALGDVAAPLVGDDTEKSLRAYLEKEGSVELQKLLELFPNQLESIQRGVKTGELREIETQTDQVSAKTQLVVSAACSLEQLKAGQEQLSTRAFRQREVLSYLIENPEAISMKQLLQECDTTSNTVRALEQKGFVQVKEQEIYRDPYEHRTFASYDPPELMPIQRQALHQICIPLQANQHAVYLLHGVTGSGKTEVYLQSIQQCLRLGKQSIVLVPEISLTPQMVERFKGRFGDRVAVMHSRLSDGERYDEWRKIQRGKVDVAIGARSAIFAPFSNIGLIVLDEEHESSYKQEESPRYNARDVAIQRAKQHGAVVVLGSATPSLESFYKAKTKQFGYIAMQERIGGIQMPPVKIVDMREELKAGNRTMFSRSLHEALVQRLERQEQAVILLNRRGFSTFVMCRACGYTAECPHCDIALTYHRHSHNLRCHYCGYAEREPTQCPECESPHIRFFGTGTQRVEEELMKHFPNMRVIRMDVDTTGTKGAHEKWLEKFKRHEADVLLGTQMVAKGLDFPKVTLVGVIAADTMLNLPDFRAAERTFQLLTQVAGRAGRHHLPGEVVVQTYIPDHYSIMHASKHDYHHFVQEELALREGRNYPPYCRMALITFSHHTVPPLMKAGGYLRNLIVQMNENYTVYGPVAAPIPRKKDRYRFQCIVKFPHEDERALSLLNEVFLQFQAAVHRQKITVSIDIDPQMLM